MLAATTLVASLLAVGASPAGAVEEKADHEAATSACVGDALGDQMFTDVSDEHAFKAAINCIAYYGITNGTGDGSTYSPNDDVTRAEMAVFIARAAGVAGVDLGDAMDAGFTDIGDTWGEARDAINRLGAKGMIPKGGEFRPGDAITRAEMASFLVGLLVKAADNVTKNSAGAILLGSGGSGTEADDWFADSRSSLPRANDAEVSAIYELGVTKGASATANSDDTKSPLGFNYEPAGTVNRGEMAAFITRALAHTPARPEGITAQYDSGAGQIVVSSRDAKFAPQANVVVDVFSTDNNGVDLALKSNGTCGEVSEVGDIGTHVCEIDGTDSITDGAGDARLPLAGTAIDDSGTVVWAWTGADKATVDSDTVLFRLDIPKDAALSMATRVRVSTEFSGAKAKLGSSVLYTVQLQDASGDVKNGSDGKKPAQFLVRLATYALVPDPSDTDPSDGVDLIRNPQQASVVTTLPLTTDGDGKATFSASGLPDPAPAVKGDKYEVDIHIQPRPSTGNAPEAAGNYFIGTSNTATPPGTTGLVPVNASANATTRGGLVFSTEASDRNAATVTVKAASNYLVASARGTSNRATVTVADQYGDPIAGAKVSLASSGAGEQTIAGGRALAVGRDGSYTFGYQRESGDAGTEQLIASWDHDDDSDTTAKTNTPAETVNWATAATSTANNTGDGADIQFVDKENNMIFTGSAGSMVMVSYDSNDRYNITPNGGTVAASNYAAFEKSITDADTLMWNIAGSGSRAVNTFTLIKA